MPRGHVGPARDDLTLNLASGVQGADTSVGDARLGQASTTTRPSSPPYASGAEGRLLPLIGDHPRT
jgi:hypothetical protein